MRARIGARSGLLAGVGIFLAGGVASGADPALVFEQTEHRFGVVSQGDSVGAEFSFRNDGPVPLTLSAPVVGCDCEAEVSGSMDVAPGATGRVRFRCNTSQRAGSQRLTATIHSSDVARRAVLLSLVGEVRLEALADPPEVYLGKVVRGQRLGNVFEIRLGSQGTQAVSLRSASTAGVIFEVERVKGARAFGVRIAPDAPPGPFTQEVVVGTSSSRFPTLTVPITGIVVDELPKKRW